MRTIVREVAERVGLDGPLSAVRRRVRAADGRDGVLRLLRNEAAQSSASVFVDVGSHRGWMIGEFLDARPDGRVVAFEPNPALAERLRARYPDAEVHAAAAADADGETSFEVIAGEPALSCMRARPRTAQRRKHLLTVPMVKLDSVLAGRHVSIVKIDVEGAQQLVLEGARETLERCRPMVLFEHGRASHATFGTSDAAIFDLLGEAGLGIAAVVNPAYEFSRGEFEAVVEAGKVSDFVARA